MRRILLFLLVVGAFQAKSQQYRFAFFQASNNQPFYIRMDDTNYSSTAFGYLVIPKLIDSRHIIFVGLPNDKSSEQKFELLISGTDRGFELKKGPSGNLRLYDWQKMSFVEPVAAEVKPKETAVEMKTDNYSRLMAGVVNDPEVARVTGAAPVPDQVVKPVASPEQPTVRSEKPVEQAPKEVSPLPKPPVDNSRTISQSTTTPSKPEDSTQPSAVVLAKPVPVAKKTIDSITEVVAKRSSDTDSGKVLKSDTDSPQITFISDRSANGYREILIVDRNSGSSDTVQVLIPLEASAPVADTVALYRVKKESSDSGTSREVKEVQLINSDCKRFASDADVDKLRIAILDANGDDSKVAEGKKVFKSRCFSTKQIRALSELFSSDDGRLKFFEASYPFVSDSGNFKTLVSLLEDTFYINRFKALVRMQD